MPLWSEAITGSRDLQVFSGWVATLIIAGFVAAFITAIGVFSPNKVSSMDAVTVVSTLNGDTLHMINQMRSGAANNAALGAQLMVCLAFHICLLCSKVINASRDVRIECTVLRSTDLYTAKCKDQDSAVVALTSSCSSGMRQTS